MHFIAKVLRKLGVSRFINQTVPLIENGRRFKIPLLGELGYSNLVLSEPWMTTLFKRLANALEDNDGLFVDVGVNIGQTLIKLKSVYPKISYVGFEPNPTCVYYVNALVDANRFHDVTLFPVGVSSKPGVLYLNLYGDRNDDSAASLIDNFRPDQSVVRSIYVPVFPCESVSLEKPLSFLKIDVEGGELEVLLGFASKIHKSRPLVLTEILPVYHETNLFRLERQRKIEALMRDMEYRCFRVLHPADCYERLVELDAIGIHSSVDWSDYLWVPEEKTPSIIECIKSR